MLKPITTPQAMKEARRTLGMRRQADLAKELGVHEITVAKWESGAKISKLTGLAVECLLRRVKPAKTARSSPNPPHEIA